MKNTIKFTPEQREIISKMILGALSRIVGNNAYSGVYYELGADPYIKGDYSFVEYEPGFIKAWNEAFKNHADKLILDPSEFKALEELVSERIGDIEPEALLDYFTVKSAKEAFSAMEKDVAGSPALKKALDAAKSRKEKSVENDVAALKKQMEEMGYEVTLKKKN